MHGGLVRMAHDGLLTGISLYQAVPGQSGTETLQLEVPRSKVDTKPGAGLAASSLFMAFLTSKYGCSGATPWPASKAELQPLLLEFNSHASCSASLGATLYQLARPLGIVNVVKGDQLVWKYTTIKAQAERQATEAVQTAVPTGMQGHGAVRHQAAEEASHSVHGALCSRDSGEDGRRMPEARCPEAALEMRDTALHQLWNQTCSPRIGFDLFQSSLAAEGYMGIEDINSMEAGFDGEEFRFVFVHTLKLKPPELRRLRAHLERPSPGWG